jgi:hypothetical protein
MLVCLLIELNIQLTGGPANSGAVQVWAIKGVAENQKSECACRNSGNRWDLLINVSLAMAAVALTRHSLANGISDAKSERTTDQQRNHNVRHARLSLGCHCLSN